jgi:hypothetical protein
MGWMDYNNKIDERMTYDMFCFRAIRLAIYLRRLGVKPGQ